MFSARFRLTGLFSSLIALSLLASPTYAERLFQSNFLTQLVTSQFAFFPDYALMGDINGDGVRDLYLVPHQGGIGRVAFGLGDGTFAPDFASNASTAWFYVLLLDLNRDGKADLIEQQSTVGAPLNVRLGLGDGNFAPAASYGAPPQGLLTARNLLAGDLDADGWTDIVYLTGDTTVVWRNHADGTLEPPVVHDVHMAGVGLADIDGDGKLDLWGEQYDTGLMAVALGNGDGTFGPVIASASIYPSAVGDLDGDGKLDALGFVDQTSTGVCFGDGSGAFTLGSSPLPLVQWDGIADLDGDGRNEGVGWDYPSSRSVVQSVNPDRSLPPASTHPAPLLTGAGDSPNNWTGFADLDGDGHADLVGTANTSVEYSVVLSGGTSPLQSVPEFATGTRPREIALGDLNGDGHLDVVTANEVAGTISVLLGNGAGGLSAHTDFSAGTRPVALVLADLDGDGHLDVAAADSTGNSVQVLKGDGSGGFGPASSFSAGTGPNGLAVGDLNHDGMLDLVAVDVISQRLAVLLASGGGAFSPPGFTALLDQPSKVALGDLDGDGNPDATVIAGGSGNLYVFRGNGGGGFSSLGTYLGSGTESRDVAMADLNGDGKLDVIAVSRGGLRTYPGNGDGTLGTPARQATRGAFGAAVADLDEDGVPDVAIASDLVGFPTPPYSGGAAFYHGMGDGSMHSLVAYGSDGLPTDLAIGDMNGDGSPDIVIANTRVSTVSILLHEVNGPVPALASITSAEALSDRVRLVWQGAPYVAATLYRRTDTSAWTVVAPVVADASGRISYEDGDVVAGQTYSYRLGAGMGASEIFFGDVTVRTPLGVSFALAGSVANPTQGPWSVSFTLPGAGAARLDIVNLAGRIVASRSVGQLGAGDHVLALPETRSLGAGIYFLRLTRGTETKLAKVVAIR